LTKNRILFLTVLEVRKSKRMAPASGRGFLTVASHGRRQKSKRGQEGNKFILKTNPLS
jgi:hypothetical protein